MSTRETSIDWTENRCSIQIYILNVEPVDGVSMSEMKIKGKFYDSGKCFETHHNDNSCLSLQDSSNQTKPKQNKLLNTVKMENSFPQSIQRSYFLLAIVDYV